MIMEKEFQERFGFEPKQDDLHRVNCDKAGEVGHYLCGICSSCGQPKFVCCGNRCHGEELQRLGLELRGAWLFAIPEATGEIPRIQVLKPSALNDLEMGICADPSSLAIFREHALSDTAYKLIVELSGIGDMKYRQLNDETIHMIRGRINNVVTAAVCEGDLFKDLTGKWRHASE